MTAFKRDSVTAVPMFLCGSVTLEFPSGAGSCSLAEYLKPGTGPGARSGCLREPRGPMPFEHRSHQPVILCVDDDRATLSALRRSLCTEPYEVITAQGSAEALAWLNEMPIDLVITDQRMPGTMGTELLLEVRKR